MNRSILIVMCDFLVSAMLSMLIGMSPHGQSGHMGKGALLDRGSTAIILDELRRRGYGTRMVPGVASFSAVAAALGRSLTEMELPLHIYPAGASDLDAALAQPGTKVLMKSGKAIGETAAALSRHGLAEASAMVADCGLPTQQVFETMTGLPEKISYFATVIVPDSKE